MSKKAVLIILDGYGIAPATPGNAITTAKKPNLDKLFSENPCTQLQASGLEVGLPKGQMGNSEVGHTNIGAGRVVFQILPKISQEIENGKFFQNPVYIKAMDDAKNGGHALHVMGLLSTGGVHSHLHHIFAALDMAKQRGVEKVYVHCFLDGRDVPPKSGAGFVKELQEKCDELGNAKIATLQGRFWGMDRDKRWDRVEKGYNAIVCGEGVRDDDAVHAVEQSYAEGEKVPEGTKIRVTVSTGVAASSEANITITLPKYSSGTSKSIKAANNNNVFMDQSVILDGSEYTITVNGSGSSNHIKVYIDSELYYECNVDFTKSPAEISNVKRHDVSESSTIPNVVGSNEASAISILKSHGFTSVEVNYINVVDSSKNGKVISQTPKNSSKAYPLSTTVIITVGKFVG